MEKCVYRIPVENDKGNEGVRKASNTATGPSLIMMALPGQLKQTFANGLCKILTANDIGPMECRQPKCNEKNCPDIAHLRK